MGGSKVKVVVYLVIIELYMCPKLLKLLVVGRAPIQPHCKNSLGGGHPSKLAVVLGLQIEMYVYLLLSDLVFR